MHALQLDELAAVEAHLLSCVACQREFAARAGTHSPSHRPASDPNPASSLWRRVAQKIGEQGWSAFEREVGVTSAWTDLEWEQAGPGISCKVLSADLVSDRICLLVRLEPGAEYPRHTHVGVEECHLLDGELWIDDLKLCPGDFNRAEPGTTDSRVWSETGCTCVVITSRGDLLV